MSVSDIKPIYTTNFERKPFEHTLKGRDFEILELVDRHGKLTSSQIIAWIESRRAYENLQKLFHNGYLDRIEPALFFSYGHVYAKSTKGARLLAKKHSCKAPRTDYSKVNRELRPWRLPHEMLTNAMRFAIDLAARNHPELQVVVGDDIRRLMPKATLQTADPFRLTATITVLDGPEEVSTRADDIIILRDMAAAGGCREKLLFIEADCATETILSRGDADFNASRIADKIEFYTAYAREKRHAAQFGINRFQVLFPTIGSAERIENMILASREFDATGSGSRRFLFTHEDRLHDFDADILSSPIWVDGQGKLAQLFD